MTLTPELLVALLNFAIKFSIDGAIAIAKALRSGASIDDAIAALELAKTKTAQNYLDDAKAKLPGSP